MKNLIKQMLVVDPETRITVKGIMEDPWFQQGLSREVVEANLNYVGEKVCRFLWQHMCARERLKIVHENALSKQQGGVAILGHMMIHQQKSKLPSCVLSRRCALKTCLCCRSLDRRTISWR